MSASSQSIQVPEEEALLESAFFCKFCKKHCINQNDLENHQKCPGKKAHNLKIRNEAIVQCSVCGKEMKYQALSRHKKILHQAGKFWSCPICSRVFGRQDSMKCHLKTHDPNYGFACDLCPSNVKFVLKRALLKHMQNVHLNDNLKVKCRFCSFRCSKGKIMQTHVLQAHPEKFETCNMCNSKVRQLSTHRCKGTEKEQTEKSMEAWRVRYKGKEEDSESEDELQAKIRGFVEEFYKELDEIEPAWEKVENEEVWRCKQCGMLFDHPVSAEDHSDIGNC